MRLYDIAKIIGIAAALAGALGTSLLYGGTFGFETFGPYTNPKLVAQMTARNRRRLRLQRVGLAFLMLSFLLGGVSVAITP